MEEKGLLISSIKKLIKHISANQKNQEQIFKSLNKNDLKKIVSNLQDQNICKIILRKISMKLVVQLLYDNLGIKEKFCQMLNLPLIPGKIVLNSRMLSSFADQSFPQAIKLLKKPGQLCEFEGNRKKENKVLYWCIDLALKPIRIQLVSKDGENYGKQNRDPNSLLFGIILPDKEGRKVSKTAELKQQALHLLGSGSTHQQKTDDNSLSLETVNLKPSIRKRNFPQTSQNAKITTLESPKNNISKIKTFQQEANQYSLDGCCKDTINITERYHTPYVRGGIKTQHYRASDRSQQNFYMQESYKPKETSDRFQVDIDCVKKATKYGGLKLTTGSTNRSKPSTNRSGYKPKITNISFSQSFTGDHTIDLSSSNQKSVNHRNSLGNGSITNRDSKISGHRMNLSYHDGTQYKPHITLGGGNGHVISKYSEKEAHRLGATSKKHDSLKDTGYLTILKHK